MCNTVHADVEDTQATGYTVVMDDRAGWYGFWLGEGNHDALAGDAASTFT